MKKTIFTDPMRTFTHACDCYKSGNHLRMHKSFRVEDSFFRKNSPKDEVLHVEFGMDAEQYVIVTAVAAVGILIICKAVSAAKHCADKRRMKATLRKRCS